PGPPSPELDIDATGAAPKAAGAPTQDTDGATLGPVAANEIVVDRLFNPGAATSVFFNAPAIPAIALPSGVSIADSTSIVRGLSSDFTYEHAFDAVTIHNESAKNVRLRALTRSTAGGAGDVTTPAGTSSNFGFTILHHFTPTEVTVENVAPAGANVDVIVAGPINNPVGTTRLTTTNGDVLRA